MHVFMYFLHLVHTFPPMTSQWKRVPFSGLAIYNYGILDGNVYVQLCTDSPVNKGRLRVNLVPKLSNIYTQGMHCYSEVGL